MTRSRRNHPRVDARELQREVNQEVREIQASTGGRLPEHRCRVCQDPESRKRVNRLLAYGMRVPEIVEHVADLNEKRPKNGQITYWSILRHSERHFNVQDPANAAYRRILERRKKQAEQDLGEGAAHLLTGMAFLDIVAQKGFEHLIDETTVVEYQEGLKAQLKLEEMQREGSIEEQVAEMRRDVSILQQAVKDVVPTALLAEISSRIDELKGTTRDDAIDAELVDDDYDDEDDDRGYDPMIGPDSGDPLEDA